MYSIIELKRNVFVLSVKVLLPHSKKWVNSSSFIDRRFGLIILHLQEIWVKIFCRKVFLSFLKFKQWRSQCLVDSIVLPQLNLGLVNPNNYDPDNTHICRHTHWQPQLSHDYTSQASCITTHYVPITHQSTLSDNHYQYHAL